MSPAAAFTVILIAWLGLHWFISVRTKFFLHHYYLCVLGLMSTAGLSTITGYAWLIQSGMRIWLGLIFLVCAVLFTVGAVLKLTRITTARYMRLGKQLMRNLTRYEVSTIAYAVDDGLQQDAFARPVRSKSLFEVKASDGIKISGYHVRAGHSKVVILAHGSARSKDTLAYVLIAEWLGYKYDVIAFDFRGHGESDGHYDFGDAGIMDLEAVVQYGKAQGYEKIGVFGRSLGGWISLLHAAAHKNVDSVIAAASPLGQITGIDTAQPFRKVVSIPILGGISQFIGEWVTANFIGTRIRGFKDAQVCPIDVVGQIAPIPIFFIYQEYDRVIKTKTEDAIKIYAAANGKKDLLILAGPGHIFEVAQLHRVYASIEQWFDETL